MQKHLSGYDVEDTPAVLDESHDPNPNVTPCHSTNPDLHLMYNADDYDTLQNLYDSKEDFRDFIENYYKRDTGEWYLSDFEEELLAIVGDQHSDFMLNYINDYTTDRLWRNLYNYRLGRGNGNGLNLQDILPTIDADRNRGIISVDMWNRVVHAQDDYKADDPNAKIVWNSYGVMPYDVFNEVMKNGTNQERHAYYKSERKYNTQVAQTEGNFDAFVSLLAIGTGENKQYVYYTVDSGTRKSPGKDMASAPDMLFEILAGNPKTANLENAMRYVLYLVTGEDYGVSDYRTALSALTKRAGANYNVTDESIFITDKNTLIDAIKSLGLSANAQNNLINNVDAFLDMQSTYHINAAFAISIAIAESSAGTQWEAIDPSTYNWMSIRGDYNGQSIGGWRKYPSFREATLDFGNLISGDTYCGSGNNTISSIGGIYCPDTEDFPNQSETWTSNTQTQMTAILRAGGVDLSAYSVGDASRCRRICFTI